MTKDEICPALAFMAAPVSIEEAASRIRHFGIHREGVPDAETFYGLVGCVFRDADQFRLAMADCGWNVRIDPIMEGASATYKAVALGQDGCEWRFILNEVGNWHMTIVNCKLVKAGNVAPETEQFIKDVNQALTQK